MTGAILVGAIMLTAVSAQGQRTSSPAKGIHASAGAVPISQAPRSPADMPPNPPKVTCDNGNLTISAENSTLAAVLTAIRVCTGVEIDIPEDAAGERLYAEVGPGPLRAVLTEFLSSTDFNYVVGSSLVDAQKIQTVLLSRRASDTAETVANGNHLSPKWRAWLETQQTNVQTATSQQGEPTHEGDSASPAAIEAAVDPATPPLVDETPGDPVLTASAATLATASAIVSGFGPGGDAGNETKSTEEMIVQMRKLYELRKQLVLQETPGEQ